ncbi:SusC/RagA family TonB-linked outer membrane protein [Marinoscillum sp.]|uniref:SusC/RagA family TonB-linked outer membrane protein n=1 Tax=Marinoscillum sp. TaxID=2024838 RepID=UPI003BAD76B0
MNFTQTKYYRTLMFMVLMLVTFWALGQGKTVTGTVTSSEDGEGLPGVSVLIEGSQQGTITDMNGNFSLSVPSSDAVLVFSFIGFTQKKVSVGSQTTLRVAMDVDIQSLEEVVVVGYGAMKKSDLTGSVASIKAEDIDAFPALSAVQTLQGRAAGVQISANNGGQPGVNYSIRVRGTNSINSSSEPIRVVDGFVGAEMPPPQDIESIEILKDASATAIYGSRGSNGVILITTKKGKSGQMKVDFNSSYSVQNTTNKLDLLNGQEFATYIQNFSPNYQYLGANTDWQDEIYRQGFISNNQLSLSGGTDAVRFYISGTLFDQDGVVIGSDYKRYSFNSNVDIKATDYLKVGVNLYGRRSTESGIRTQEGSGGSGQAGVVGAAMRFNPDLGIYNEDGSFTVAQVGDQIDNPFAMATEYDRERVTDRFQTNTFAELSITDWLSFKTTLGIGITNSRDGEFWPTTLIRGAGSNGFASLSSDKSTSLLSENYFTISKTFGIHNFVWVNGYSYQKNAGEGWSTSSSGFINDAGRFWALVQGSEPGTPSSGYGQSIIKSYYTRFNYSLMDRYNFTFTARQDGASNFSKNNKWAFFPSGAFAWNVKEESFMQGVSAIDQLKLRVSYGEVGNQAIGSYQSLARLSPFNPPTAGLNALGPTELSNSYLTWETTSQFNIGTDIGLIKGRVNITMDYYKKTTNDLLFRRELPSYIGVDDQYQNVGAIENKGFEFSLNSNNLVGDFKWETNFNISANRNRILELPDSVEYRSNGPGHMLLGITNVLVEGQPIGAFYGYQYDGIYQVGDEILPGSGFEQVPGGEKFKDVSGADGGPDGELSNEDRVIIGDPNPDFIWALNNTFKYKGFDLNVFFQGSHGNDMMSFTQMELETLSGKANASRVALRAWTPENPNTDIPMASSGRTYKVSSRWVYDGSYVRLKNIVLGYTFPGNFLDKVHIRSLRVYASAQNLLTITDYPGLDPEVSYRNGSSTSGLDYAGYPNVRTFTFGLNLGL